MSTDTAAIDADLLADHPFLEQTARLAPELASSPITRRLPDSYPDRGEPVPAGLVGSEVVGFGAAQADREHTLVIDYRRPGESQTRRVVLEFSEMGMWAAYIGDAKAPPTAG